MSSEPQKYKTELPKPVREQLDIREQYDLKQLREALRGKKVAADPAPAPKNASAKPIVPKHGPQDLISSLASRLTKVEMENQQLKAMLKRANSENVALQRKVDLCRLAAAGEQAHVDEILALKSYIEVLQQQIYDMELYLDAHGLVYVECDGNPKAPVPQREPDRESVTENTWTPPERDVLEHNIRSLNRLVSKDRIVVASSSNQAHYNDKPAIPVRFYPNGIFIKRGPFRAYDQDATARAFVDDIAAGFLPSEFREGHPDGISIDAAFESELFRYGNVELFHGQVKTIGTDEESGAPPPPPKPALGVAETAAVEAAVRRNYVSVSEYGAKHNYVFDKLHDQRANLEKPMSLQHFLSRVKGSYMSNGQVVPVKDAIGMLVRGQVPATTAAEGASADKDAGAAGLSSTRIIAEEAEDGRVAVLRVRVSSLDPALNDQHLLLKLPFTTVIATVVDRIAESLQIAPGRVRLHRPYGRDLMEDMNATLEETECTPNARIFAKIGT